MEHVWIASDSRTQVGICRFLPLIVERYAVDVAKTHGCHAAGDHVKATSNADDVKVMVRAIRQIDTVFIEADDSIVLDVDDVNVGSIKLLKVSILETRSLDTPVVRHVEWCEYVLLLRVIDARSLLFGPEIICLLVSFLIKEIVLICPARSGSLRPAKASRRKPLVLLECRQTDSFLRRCKGSLQSSVRGGEGVQGTTSWLSPALRQ